MTTKTPRNKNRLSCLAVSVCLVLSFGSSSWANRDINGPHRPGGAVVDVPAPPGVPVPGVPVPVPPNLRPKPPGAVEHRMNPQLRDKPGPPGKDFHGPVVLPERNRPRPEQPPRFRDRPRDPRWDRPDRDFAHRPWDRGHRPHFGSIHRDLPHDTFRFFLGGIPFFYTGGVYFRPGPEGYVVVEPPLGARIRILPEDCSFFYFRGQRCYSCDDDVFYREIDGEYEVIEKPPRFRLIANVGDEVTVVTDSLNVRTGPGPQYPVINNLQRGETGEVGGINGDWYYVHLPDGTYGWIMRTYTRISRLEDRPKG